VYLRHGRQPDGSISCPTGSYLTTGNVAALVDAGWDAPQDVDIDNTQINGALYADEP
jgi:hypothetical protein